MSGDGLPGWVPGVLLLVLALLLVLVPYTGYGFLGSLVGLGGVALLVGWMEANRKWAAAARNLLVADGRAARADADAATRSREECFATLSHELRGPLSAILGWVRILRSGTLDEAASVRALETIARNAKGQARVINDLFDVSRIIRGTIRLNVRPVDLAILIRHAAESVQPEADARGVHLESRFVLMDGAVSADPARLQQVMENLFSNAIKFTPSGGRVTIGLRYDERQATITITDTGQGIRPDFLPHVFDRFRQANSAGGGVAGLGLGLAIVRHLIELHGGTVSAASDGQGQGAQFTVTLPLTLTADANDSGGSLKAEPDTAWRGNRLRTYQLLR